MAPERSLSADGPGTAMSFDSIEFDPFRFAYVVRKGKRHWEVPLDLIRSIKDPDFLDAVNAAAALAWKEGRVTPDEVPGAVPPPPRSKR
jgi:hypothetical protein